MSGAEKWKEQPQIGNRDSNPVAINQFLIFLSLLGSHVLVLFSHLLIFFMIWLTSFDLINLKFFPCLCSNLFTENEAQII